MFCNQLHIEMYTLRCLNYWYCTCYNYRIKRVHTLVEYQSDDQNVSENYILHHLDKQGKGFSYGEGDL